MTRPTLGPERAGFTLIEILVVVVIVGIIVGIGFPSLNRAKVKSDIRSARGQAVALYYQARSTAFMTGRFTALTFTGNQAVITATPRLSPGVGTADTIGNVQDLGQLYAVTVTVTPGVAKPLGSVTFPVIVPNRSCAAPGRLANTAIAIATSSPNFLSRISVLLRKNRPSSIRRVTVTTRGWIMSRGHGYANREPVTRKMPKGPSDKSSKTRANTVGIRPNPMVIQKNG